MSPAKTVSQPPVDGRSVPLDETARIHVSAFVFADAPSGHPLDELEALIANGTEGATPETVQVKWLVSEPVGKMHAEAQEPKAQAKLARMNRALIALMVALTGMTGAVAFLSLRLFRRPRPQMATREHVRVTETL